MAAAKDDARKLVAENRRARHEFFLTETWEAGLMLTGTEVKSLRKGKRISRRAMRRSRTTALSDKLLYSRVQSGRAFLSA